jgi:hypothetical protein
MLSIVLLLEYLTSRSMTSFPNHRVLPVPCRGYRGEVKIKLAFQSGTMSNNHKWIWYISNRVYIVGIRTHPANSQLRDIVQNRSVTRRICISKGLVGLLCFLYPTFCLLLCVFSDVLCLHVDLLGDVLRQQVLCSLAIAAGCLFELNLLFHELLLALY